MDLLESIWIFMAGLHENFPAVDGQFLCSCSQGNYIPKIPSLVGNNYFCESGCPDVFIQENFYSLNPLWDIKQCGTIETD